MTGDPLGAMDLSPMAIKKRDEIVFAAVLQRQAPIPIVMVLSGGYQMSNAEVIAESIINLNNKFSLMKEEFRDM